MHTYAYVYLSSNQDYDLSSSDMVWTLTSSGAGGRLPELSVRNMFKEEIR